MQKSDAKMLTTWNHTI